MDVEGYRVGVGEKYFDWKVDIPPTLLGFGFRV